MNGRRDQQRDYSCQTARRQRNAGFCGMHLEGLLAMGATREDPASFPRDARGAGASPAGLAVPGRHFHPVRGDSGIGPFYHHLMADLARGGAAVPGRQAENDAVLRPAMGTGEILVGTARNLDHRRSGTAKAFQEKPAP